MDSQISYKNLNGIYITGEKSSVVGTYCTDIFNILNEMYGRQSSLSDMIDVLPTFKGENFANQEKTISKALIEDVGTLNNINIVEMPETSALEDMKIKNYDLLENNRHNFLKTLSDKLFIIAKDEMQKIDASIKKVSGENIKNFSKEYKNIDDFKVQILDSIDNIKANLKDLPDDEQKKSSMEELNTIRKKAFAVYNIKLDLENIKKKIQASGADMDEMKKIFEQIFPGTKSSNKSNQ